MLAIIWTSPWTLVGMMIGGIGLATGGSAQRVGRVLEFHGGWLTWLLTRALTLGHTVLARTAGDLDRTRAHERIHVAQYERWGLCFVPAYLGCSAWLWLRGRDPYWDNPFEREAYGKELDAQRDQRSNPGAAG